MRGEVPGRIPPDYVSALLLDIERESAGWTEAGFESVYFGGGTPSLLSPCQVESIIDTLHGCFRIEENAEVTMECNPGSMDTARLRAYRNLGINRISVGVQSVSDAELKALGRRHRAAEALAALETARAAGFDNLSADLMLGIPGQHPDSLRTTLKQLAGLVDHVSAYLLSVEPGTEFARQADLGRLDLPDSDEVVGLFEQADRDLEAGGFTRYEVSNWSRPGFECRHNLMYWRRGEYAGVGAGAHSHRGVIRYSRVESPAEYVARIARGDDPVDMRERLTGKQKLIEEIMLGLRTRRGLDLSTLREAPEIDSRGMDAAIVDLVEEGLLFKNGNFLQLSPKGIKVCDSVTESVSASALTC
jgi:oxygen-independent coproporphyrinogen-3 oxidase